MPQNSGLIQELFRGSERGRGAAAPTLRHVGGNAAAWASAGPLLVALIEVLRRRAHRLDQPVRAQQPVHQV